MRELELLASGYGTVEGPTVDDAGDLYFSDITGGGVRRMSPDRAIELVVPKRKGVGGICLHRDGGLVVSGRDLSHVRDGETRILLGRDDYAGLGLPYIDSYNDIHADDEGRIFAGTVMLDENGERLKNNMLILLTAEKKPVVLYDGFTSSNGMALDWTRQRLYHCASRDRQFIVSDKVGDADYRIACKLTTEAAPGTPDGMALDMDGCIWAAFYRGGCAARFSPGGEMIERIDMPAHLVTSVCFAGPDGQDLIIVTQDNTERPELGGCIFRTRVSVPGAPVGIATI
jgi:gluconolactonase